MALVVIGRLNKQIAHDIGISEDHTVKGPSWPGHAKDEGGFSSRRADRIGGFDGGGAAVGSDQTRLSNASGG
jgi:hypothetical protein